MFPIILLRGLGVLLMLFSAAALLWPERSVLPALGMLAAGAALLALAQLLAYVRDVRDLACAAVGGLEVIERRLRG